MLNTITHEHRAADHDGLRAPMRRRSSPDELMATSP
jgi:hypothetical protein